MANKSYKVQQERRVQEVSNIKKIRDYFNVCPLLDEDARINVDYWGNEPIEYTIYSEPSQTIVKQYVDGGSIRQYQFTFIIYANYSADLGQQLDNTGFLEDFSDWIEENNKKGILPAIEGAYTLEALGNGFPVAAEDKTIQFQIPLRVLYRR